MNENEIGTIIINTAIAVHRELGPGLLESVYENVMAHEIRERGMNVSQQVVVPVIYKNMKFDHGFRADMIVENKVIIEFKSVENISPVHRKQLHTYLALSKNKLGYLLNFGAALMKDGIVRSVNGLTETPLCASASLRENSLTNRESL